MQNALAGILVSPASTYKTENKKQSKSKELLS